jgi:hypothetical protein
MRTIPQLLLLTSLVAVMTGSSVAPAHAAATKLVTPVTETRTPLAANSAMAPAARPVNLATRPVITETALPVAEARTPNATQSVITSNAVTGSWFATTSWVGGVVPGASDDVIIADGATITIDNTGGAANSITVGQGVSGILQFETATARTITVGGNVTIAAGGTFRSGATGPSTHLLSLGGSLTNNGTLDFSTNANASGAGITFTGAGNATFGGTGVTTDIFGPLTVNKGTSAASVLTLNPTAFTFKGATSTAGTTAAYLTITNGTFEIAGTFTMSNGVFTGTGNYTIPATGGFRLNNPNYTVAARNGSMTLNGLLRVDQGTLGVGTASGNSISYATGSTITINGGVVNVAGRISGAATTTVGNYTQTGGVVTVVTVGSTSSTLSGFDLPTAASSFTMSGGTIVHRLLTSANDYQNLATNLNITGGTLQFGDASSGAAKQFWAVGSAPSVVISNTSAAHTLFTNGDLNVFGNATLNTGTTLLQGTTTNGGFVFFVTGNVTNAGTISGNFVFSRFYFGGTSAQTYSGAGVAGTTAAPLQSWEIDNPAGLTMSAASPTVITLRANLFKGTVTNSNKIQLGVAGTSTAATQIGGDPANPGGNYDVAPIFNPAAAVTACCGCSRALRGPRASKSPRHAP